MVIFEGEKGKAAILIREDVVDEGAKGFICKFVKGKV